MAELLESMVTDWRQAGSRRVVVLTGAGISAESGIPTFRGPEGYWTVGSENYRPEELATYRAFRRMPEAIWAWYLMRKATCDAAQPNAAHRALVELEGLGEGFRLVTQNVDGLHVRAGSSPRETWHIHGTLAVLRCADECGIGKWAMPDLPPPGSEPRERLSDAERAALTCPRCGDWARPHVLWFDECYDEPNFRFESSVAAVDGAGMLVVIGTSGATTLPATMVQRAAQLGVPLLVIGPEPTPFSELAERVPGSGFARGTATEIVPELVARLTAEN